MMIQMSNILVFLVSLVVISGTILTLVGLSEIKSLLKKEVNLPESHIKFHITLIVLSIAFPVLLTVQLIKLGIFFIAIKKGFWITYVLYNAFTCYLYLHLREERKGELLGDISFKKVLKIIGLKILELIK